MRSSAHGLIVVCTVSRFLDHGIKIAQMVPVRLSELPRGSEGKFFSYTVQIFQQLHDGVRDEKYLCQFVPQVDYSCRAYL